MKYEEFMREVARLADGKDCSVAFKQKVRGKYPGEYTGEELDRILEEAKEMTFEEYQAQCDYEIVGVHVYNEDFSNAADNPYLKSECLFMEISPAKSPIKRQTSD